MEEVVEIVTNTVQRAIYRSCAEPVSVGLSTAIKWTDLACTETGCAQMQSQGHGVGHTQVRMCIEHQCHV